MIILWNCDLECVMKAGKVVIWSLIPRTTRPVWTQCTPGVVWCPFIDTPNCVSVFYHTATHSRGFNSRLYFICNTTLVCIFISVDRLKCSDYNIKFMFQIRIISMFFLRICDWVSLRCSVLWIKHHVIYRYIFGKVILNELVWSFCVVESSFRCCVLYG